MEEQQHSAIEVSEWELYDKKLSCMVRWAVENLRFRPLEPLTRIKISKKSKILFSDHRESQTISNICHRAKFSHSISNIDRRPTAFRSLRLRKISKGCRILLFLQEPQTTSNATVETPSNHMNTDGRLTTLARLSFWQRQLLIKRLTISENERCCLFTENLKPLSRISHVVPFWVFQTSIQDQQDAQIGDRSTLFQALQRVKQQKFATYHPPRWTATQNLRNFQELQLGFVFTSNQHT